MKRLTSLIKQIAVALQQIEKPSQKPRKTQKDTISKILKSLLWDFRRDNYQEYLKSDEWKAKRKKILKMAGYKCRRCGASATEVHHETYERIYNERDIDLTALCSNCHRKIHTNQ